MIDKQMFFIYNILIIVAYQPTDKMQQMIECGKKG